ncbi:MAG: PKD domain-containing protein [Pigmentiphaga sp.]|uniref:PKD domain-containing protein n=1 Tax=Pigmentiphaga sp. TaxID=1977564 RepID=UPI0029B82BB8|nr:PKD domain-containing protein [Pigmentiphaga sp.]MDX3904649.1 PKD domain-containing protein [Pigmentiphaga sp.]
MHEIGTNARRLCAALGGALVLALAACGSGEDSSPGGGEPPPVENARAVIEAQAARSMTSVGQPVGFRASAVTDGIRIEQYRWTFSDGQQATGQEVSASFAASGPVTVTVQAYSGGQAVAEASAAVVVVDAGASPFEAFGIPSGLGNVTGNDRPGLVDAMRIAQYIEGVVGPEDIRVAHADIDLDGKVDEIDRNLAMQAAAARQALPSALLRPQAYPGAVVAMVSPMLLDPNADVSITVDGVASPQVFRALPGYASFLVPAGLIRNAAAEVVVSVNGVPSDRLSLDLLAAAEPTAPAADDIRAFFDQIDRLLQAQHDAIVADPGRLSTESVAQLRTLAAAGRDAFGNARLELERTLAGPNGDTLARLFQKALLANGMREFLAASQGVAGEVNGKSTAVSAAAVATPEQICDIILPELCRLKRGAEQLGNAASITEAACSAVSAAIFVGGAIIPADGPAIEVGAVAAFVKFCVPMSAIVSTASTLGEIVKPIDPRLYLTVTPTFLDRGENALVKPEVTFVGLQHLCGMFSSGLTELVVGQIIGKRIVAAILRNNTGARLLADFFAKYAEDMYVSLLESLEEAAYRALDASGLMGAFSEFVTQQCAIIPTGRANMPAQRVMLPLPSDQGSYSFNADGTANYTCPSAPAVLQSQITLRGMWPMCGKTAEVSEKVFCTPAQVGITMGDNGNLLDDIFEVVINGRSVLTSNQPVRSVSTTLPLGGGLNEVLMRGLAAPDQVGTYFITFSGATVVSGDALSGSDLTPGVTKRFLLEVE